jgi:hypothetical protein
MAFEKAPTVAKHKAHENDTGSTRVQVALLTERINYLNDHHFRSHTKGPSQPPWPAEDGRQAETPPDLPATHGRRYVPAAHPGTWNPLLTAESLPAARGAHSCDPRVLRSTEA